MGSGLLQHDLLARALVGAPVDAAPVGEVQRLIDRVGDVVQAARSRPRRQVGRQARRGRHPVGHREHRAPHVGHELALGVLDRQHPGALLVVAPAGGETAVADVDRPRPPAKVAQDVRTGLAGEQLVEVDTGAFELGIVVRIDRDQLAATPATCVLGVAGQHDPGAAEKLEGDIAPHAAVPNGADDALGIVEATSDVNLPTLRRKYALGGVVNDPMLGGVTLPSRRGGTLAHLEGLVVSAVGRCIVEGRSGHAERFVIVVHDAGNLPPEHVTSSVPLSAGEKFSFSLPNVKSGFD
jgi:hypothetical protein